VAFRAPCAADRPPPERKRVLDPSASLVVTDILADHSARALTFGLDGQLAIGSFAAVKTGTSKDMRDNWCLGFSERYTVGVWVGNAGGESMHAVCGVSGAAPIGAGLMSYLQARSPSHAPTPPPGAVARQVRFELGDEAPRREWLLAGTELDTIQRTALARRGQGGEQGIRNPREGSIYALDPDIPPQSQKLQFEGENGVRQLDGRRIGRGDSLWWSPRPGRHDLKLLSTAGILIETVNFEVRGARLGR